MKKMLIALMLTLTQLFSLSSLPMASSSDITEVIVTVNVPEGEDACSYLTKCADILSKDIRDCEYGYIYDTVMHGFSLKLPESSLPSLNKYSFIDEVFADGKYSALSYDEIKMNAATLAGITDDITNGLSGDGVKVAVIDNAFNTSHPAFDADVTETLDLEPYQMQIGIPIRLTALRYMLNVMDFRCSAKIPYAFDYADHDNDVFDKTADHGTHVAGIIGAVSTDTESMHGIAPGCQLILMKVFSDGAVSASDSAILAAIEDSVKLGADVINLSIGNYAGSTDLKTIGLDAAINKARESGCIVVCAAGNDSISVKHSAASLPLASYTDYGTVSSPSTSDFTVSVASAENRYEYTEHFLHAIERDLRFYFTDTNKEFGIIDTTFSGHFNNRTLEYVHIGGVGEELDYENVDANGKLVLVQRGTITFAEKANIAARHGAIGVIVYNNVPNEYQKMDLTGAAIPAIAVTLEEGEILLSKEEKLLSFSKNYTYFEKSGDAGLLSEFSSWGVTPSLTLKPDITAIGGGVYSTVNEGYDGFSGTSMATPQFSGMCALLIEKARDEGADANIVTALMNSAIPIKQSNGVEYSPRGQGAGLVNLAAALNREVEITYGEAYKPKAELFDKLTGNVAFDVTVRNLTDSPLDITLGATLTSDGCTELTVNDKTNYYSTLEAISDSKSFIRIGDSGNINRYADSYSPHALTLDAGESRTLTITLSLDGKYYTELGKIFTNGYFIEGFVYCETKNTSASLPYVGYVGDFAKSPVLDADVYSNDTVMITGTRLMVKFEGTYLPSGANIFTAPYDYTAGKVAFSPNSDERADTLNFAAPQLRNARSSVMNIKSIDGKILYTESISHTTKANGTLSPVLFYFTWNGGDGIHERYRFPDGDYIFEVVYTLDFGEDNTQTYSYDVKIDTTAPKVEKITLVDDILRIKANDESGILLICVYEGNPKDKTKYRELDEDAAFDISEIEGDTVYYEIVDSAYNVTTGRLRLSRLAGEQ